MTAKLTKSEAHYQGRPQGTEHCARRKLHAHNKLPDAMRQQAISLYVDALQTIPEVAAVLGRGTTTVARWLKAAKATRPMGAAFALAAQKGRKKWGRGQNIPWQSAKTGRWEFADSRWEAVRMQQLDTDATVRTWTRLAERIPYVAKNGKPRFYAPDFLVEYVDSHRVVEEVKPLAFAKNPDTLVKAAAALQALQAVGIEYRIVTEDDIGLAAINRFRVEGLAAIGDEQRRLADNKRRAARLRKKHAPRINANREKHRQRAEQAAALYASGMTLVEVGSVLRVHAQTILNWLDKRGVERRVAVMRPEQRQRQGGRMRLRATAAAYIPDQNGGVDSPESWGRGK